MATTTTKKATKRDNYSALLALTEVRNNPQLTAFIQHEIELLDKKNSAERKPTKEDEAKTALRAQVVQIMEAEPNRLWTCTELAKELNRLNQTDSISCVRVNALIQPMLEDKGGNIRRTEDKRKAYFQLAK